MSALRAASRLSPTSFSICTALTTFTVPASVTEIKSDAFEGCESLRAFVVEDGNTAFLSRDGVVYNKDWTICYFPPAKETYEIPKQVTVLPDGFFSSTSIKSVTVESGNSAFTVADDVLYTADRAGSSSSRSVRLPSRSPPV